MPCQQACCALYAWQLLLHALEQAPEVQQVSVRSLLAAGLRSAGQVDHPAGPGKAHVHAPIGICYKLVGSDILMGPNVMSGCMPRPVSAATSMHLHSVLASHLRPMQTAASCVKHIL